MRHLRRWLSLFICASASWLPVAAFADAGAYLSGRAAFYANDFDIASRKLTEAFTEGQRDPELIDWIMFSHVADGRFEAASLFISQREQMSGTAGEIGSLLLLAEAMNSGDIKKLDKALEAQKMQGPLIPAMVSAWAHVERGDLRAARDAMQRIPDAKGPLAPYLAYMEGLMRSMVQSPKEAVAFFQTDEGSPALEIPQAFQNFIVLAARAGEFDLAAKKLQPVSRNQDPINIELFAAVEEKRVPNLPLIDTPAKGMSEFLSILAARLARDFDPLWRLAFSRSAEFMAPTYLPPQIVSGDLLAQIDQFNRAVTAYDRVAPQTPYFYHAQSGRVDAFLADEAYEEASGALMTLSEKYPQNAALKARLGDAYRYQEKFDLSEAVYSDAIALLTEDDPRQWQFLFSRGIARERQGKWPEAEVDMRKSIALNPGNANVLNYLGYSMLEQGGAYDEALGFIEKAVEQAPNQGHIIDSLAWAHYRLGDYEKAVKPMEQAAELMPFDPIVNDHLGDVYFRVGRIREALVQWRRALSLDPEPEEAEKIRIKIETKALVDDGK